MTQQNSTQQTTTQNSPATTDGARALLGCGIASATVFTVVATAQVLTRDGFDLRRHPLSLLSNGDWGWVQIANFIVTGLLAIAFAVGLRRSGRVGTWVPRLITLYGIGLIAGGVFVADPGLGFPEGAPAGVPDELTWHGMLHAVAPALAFLSLVIACFVFARRSAACGERGWVAYSLITGVAALLLSAWPTLEWSGVKLAAAIALGFAWQIAIALRLRRELADEGAERV